MDDVIRVTALIFFMTLTACDRTGSGATPQSLRRSESVVCLPQPTVAIGRKTAAALVEAFVAMVLLL
jgi:hypothetical protein